MSIITIREIYERERHIKQYIYSTENDGCIIKKRKPVVSDGNIYLATGARKCVITYIFNKNGDHIDCYMQKYYNNEVNVKK